MGEWRGTAPQPRADAPCGVCDRLVEDDERFVCSGWIVYRRCAVENAEGAADRGNDWLGVANRGGTGPPRRRAFLLTEILPRIHMKYDRATDRGAYQQRQLEIIWRPVNSDAEGVANRHEGDQHVHEGRGDDTETACTYCGRDLDDSAGESGNSHAPVLIQCGHGGVRTRMLHAGPGGSHRERTYRSEALRSVPIDVAGGQRVAQDRTGREMDGGEECPTVRRPPSAGRSQNGASQLRDDRGSHHVRTHGEYLWEEPNLFVRAVLPFQ